MALMRMLDVLIKTFILVFVVISYLVLLLEAREENRTNLGNSFLIN